MRTVSAVAVAVAICLGVFAGATGAGVATGSSRSSALASQRATRPAAVLRMQTSGPLHGDTATRPGRTTFSLSASGPSGNVLFFAPRRAGGPMQLSADLHALIDTGKPIAVERDFLNLGGIVGAGSFSIVLPRGKVYAIIATYDPKPANILTLTVRGRPRASVFGKSSTTIKAAGADAWAPAPTSIPHRGIVTFVNSSNVVHDLHLLPLGGGVTIAQARANLEGSRTDFRAIFAMQAPSLSIAALSAHQSEQLKYDLPRGRYALMDYWPSRDGTSRYALGMVRQIMVR